MDHSRRDGARIKAHAVVLRRAALPNRPVLAHTPGVLRPLLPRPKPRHDERRSSI